MTLFLNTLGIPSHVGTVLQLHGSTASLLRAIAAGSNLRVSQHFIAALSCIQKERYIAAGGGEEAMCCRLTVRARSLYRIQYTDKL